MTPTGGIPRLEKFVFFIPAIALSLATLASAIALVTNQHRLIAAYLLAVIGVIVWLFAVMLSAVETIDGPGIFGVAFLVMGMTFVGPILLSIGLIGLTNGATKSVRSLSFSSLALTWIFVICVVVLNLVRWTR
ncbi:hypothetical protein [Ruegeria arenilitoris]|uniref:hypothetical protein n=1 Tax=Ruegeria arenilitoris TaxID=1173585 RepID=UPI00147EC8D2|nr:hypothetical protein [Ruegeria arenilitoris]